MVNVLEYSDDLSPCENKYFKIISHLSIAEARFQFDNTEKCRNTKICRNAQIPII